jgi:hypothetical protein
LYFPAFNVTEVPLDDPENDFGEGFLPDTVIVKSDGVFVPPFVLSTFVITLRNDDDPIGDVELFVEPPLPFEDDDDEDEVVFVPFFAAKTEWESLKTKLAGLAVIINNIVSEIVTEIAKYLHLEYSFKFTNVIAVCQV